MASKIKLGVFPDLGGQMNIGYSRTDTPIVHIVVRAPGGAAFSVRSIREHFAECAVCEEHGVTFEMFDHFMKQEP